MRRLLLTLSLAGLTLALWAPAALAGKPDNGEGLWGETNDKVVTDAGFLLIGSFRPRDKHARAPRDTSIFRLWSKKRSKNNRVTVGQFES